MYVYYNHVRTFNFSGQNISVEQLEFTTVDHLLADIALLVTQVRHNFDATESKVILFGSRLGGTLAILARKKFPHLVDGAWSSGGIFRATVPEFCELSSDRIYRSVTLKMEAF